MKTMVKEFCVDCASSDARCSIRTNVNGNIANTGILSCEIDTYAQMLKNLGYKEVYLESYLNYNVEKYERVIFDTKEEISRLQKVLATYQEELEKAKNNRKENSKDICDWLW